jgi:diadenosine tetraphosphate (Ap4A) HIT family hydrolase
MTPDTPPCPICADNEAADRDDDPWFVARLATGYVRLAPTQYHRGATFFASATCVREVYDLPRPVRQAHLLEMADVAGALAAAFEPRKMNIEALGNGVPHLHWWLTPRHDDDPRPQGPIWEDLAYLRQLWTGGLRPPGEERDRLKQRLLRALEDGGLTIERRCDGQGLD